MDESGSETSDPTKTENNTEAETKNSIMNA